MSTRYKNGQVPMSALVEFDTGDGMHWGTPYQRYVWYKLRALVKKRHGVTLHISPGWCVYRPLGPQKVARQDACDAGNCDGAAVPGYSSHGLTWVDDVETGGVWVDYGAFDIGDWSQLTWDEFAQACRDVGLRPGIITVARAGRTEPWHVGLPDPWRSVPEEDPLSKVETVYTKFNPNQPIGPKADYINHSGTKQYSSLLDLNAGDYLLPGGVLDIELEHPQPTKVTLPDGTVLPVPVAGTFQVQAHAVTVDSTGKVVPGSDVPLGIEEIIPTTGRTMRQIPLPPRRIGKGQRIRITISATDGLTGKIVSAEFRGSKVPKPTA